MTAIRVSNVYKIFGPSMTHARVIDMLRHGASKADVLADNGCNVGLNNINLNIEAGQIFVIMGLSGSGKSTLVRHFNRLIDPSAGEIVIDGENILSLNAAGLRVSAASRQHGVPEFRPVAACNGAGERGVRIACKRRTSRCSEPEGPDLARQGGPGRLRR